jgi:hypothetical protein
MSNSDLPQEFEGEVEEDERADSNGEECDVRHGLLLFGVRLVSRCGPRMVDHMEREIEAGGNE